MHAEGAQAEAWWMLALMFMSPSTILSGNSTGISQQRRPFGLEEALVDRLSPMCTSDTQLFQMSMNFPLTQTPPSVSSLTFPLACVLG